MAQRATDNKMEFMGVKSVFGNNLKIYRKAKNMSQEELCEKVNISIKHLSSIERGMTFVSSGLLEKLALCIGVPVSRFFVTVDDVFEADEKERYGDAMFDRIDKIIDKNLTQAVRNIKADIRR